MLRGTILLVGEEARETEILGTRLEREHFSIVHADSESKVNETLNQESVLAVLCRDTCSRKRIEKIISATKRTKSRRIPIILVSDGDISDALAHIPGVGEVFRLHSLSLSEMIRRLRLAIQLSQLS